ncbi:MucR family transcriptional regulator [Streptacidiphilus sp. EB103A]|uniref:MucR family transcriptional regulator n=1 Tax=Streptacidiphilus sp. EB103A TaxID=3156275 RepID=UPI003515F6D6
MTGTMKRPCTACSERVAVAKGLCLRCYKRARRGRPDPGGDARAYGQPDGFGRYGVLEDDGQSVLCHECGGSFQSLAAHAAGAHGMTADQYRAAHGLSRGQGLVCAQVSAKFSANSRSRIGSESWKRFERARDPQAASAARTFPADAAQTRHVQVVGAQALGRATRKGTVRSCRVCGAQWCPLPGGYNRVTCRSAECLAADKNRSAREHAKSRAAGIRPLSDQEREQLRTLTGPALRDLVLRLVRDHGMAQRGLAPVVGLSEAGLSRFLKGTRVPSADKPRPPRQ